MRIRKLVSGIRQKYFAPRKKIVEAALLGHPLKVFEGTVRGAPDRDDAWYYQLALNARLILDVGCNVGYTSLLALVANKSCRVVLFDSNPQALSIAATNIIYNGLSTRCQFVSGFLSQKSGERVKFYTVGTGSAGSINPDHAKTAAMVNSWYWVNTTSLDEVCNELGVIPDFVKIDVEGAEFAVLSGATSLAKHPLRIMVEMHSNKDLSMVQNARNVLDWCERVGYSAWYMTDRVIMDSAELISHRGRCHLLLQPKKMNYPEFLQQIMQGDAIPQ